MLRDIDSQFSGNLLLSALRLPDQVLLKPHLELKEYARGEALFEVGEDVSYIAFPLGQCVADAILALRAKGHTVEPCDDDPTLWRVDDGEQELSTNGLLALARHLGLVEGPGRAQ